MITSIFPLLNKSDSGLVVKTLHQRVLQTQALRLESSLRTVGQCL